VNIGLLYLNGFGVERDPSQAFPWFRKAADQGNASGQILVGVAYRDGRGVEQNYAQAMTWFLKAADQGSAPAQMWIGQLYELGQGVGKDSAQASTWYKKASDQGYEPGRTALRRLQGNAAFAQRERSESSVQNERDFSGRENGPPNSPSATPQEQTLTPTDSIRVRSVGPPSPGTHLPGGQPAQIQLELTYALNSADQAFLGVYAEEFVGATSGCTGGHHTNGGVTIPVVRGEHQVSLMVPWRGSSNSGYVAVGANLWKNVDGHTSETLKKFGLFPDLCFPFGSSTSASAPPAAITSPTPVTSSTPNFAGDWIETNPRNPDHPFKLRIDQSGNQITVSGRPMEIVNGVAKRTVPQGCGPQFQKPGYDYNGPDLAGPNTLTLGLADSGATLVYEIVVDWIVPCDGHAKGLDRTEYQLRRPIESNNHAPAAPPPTSALQLDTSAKSTHPGLDGDPLDFSALRSGQLTVWVSAQSYSPTVAASFARDFPQGKLVERQIPPDNFLDEVTNSSVGDKPDVAFIDNSRQLRPILDSDTAWQVWGMSRF
jgi:hypothetical protein